MNLTHAISEPLTKLIAFHNAFNRNVKLTYGAIAQLGVPSAPNATPGPVVLPNGGEPWGRSRRWNDLNEAIRGAAVFISEMGVARAASAFEDYLIGVTAELDRATARAHPGRQRALERKPQPKTSDSDDAELVVASLRRLVARLEVDAVAIASDIAMVEFFEVARNCILHRSNRASRRLAELKASPELVSALTTWPRRQGKWALSVPDVSEGEVVVWLPRHAIMASAAYHRCASLLDRAVMAKLGPDGVAAMAAYWCLLADNRVPCPAKLDAQTMVRTQLVGRYLVRSATITEIVQALRNSGIWGSVMDAFSALGLVKARHAKRRIARRGRK